MDQLKILKQKAIKLGATDLKESNRKNKRLMVIYEGKKIHFGLKNGSTFIDHNDKQKRRAWRARHGKIKLKDGRLAHAVKSRPSFWSWNILW